MPQSDDITCSGLPIYLIISDADDIRKISLGQAQVREALEVCWG